MRQRDWWRWRGASRRARKPPRGLAPEAEIAWPEADADAIVATRQLTKRLGERAAIEDLTLTIRQGELMALIGPSGSGKTTTVRLICGIYLPDQGEVRLFGHVGAPWPRPVRSRFGYMPQTYSLYPRMTAAENLRYAAALHGVDRAQTAKRLEATLELVDLQDQRDRLTQHMSGGQRRRLALAVALMHDPELLFVDEPTAGLDPALRARLWAYFRQFTRMGRTVVVTTQYIDEAELTDRVAVLRAARMVGLGTPQDLAREAFGGEIVELRSEDLTTQAARALTHVEGVHEVTFQDLETLQVIVDVAEVAAPLLLGTLARWGCTVRSIGLKRPRFEDVFLRLTGIAPTSAIAVRGEGVEVDQAVATHLPPDTAGGSSHHPPAPSDGEDASDA